MFRKRKTIFKPYRHYHSIVSHPISPFHPTESVPTDTNIATV